MWGLCIPRGTAEMDSKESINTTKIVESINWFSDYLDARDINFWMSVLFMINTTLVYDAVSAFKILGIYVLDVRKGGCSRLCPCVSV